MARNLKCKGHMWQASKVAMEIKEYTSHIRRTDWNEGSSINRLAM